MSFWSYFEFSYHIEWSKSIIETWVKVEDDVATDFLNLDTVKQRELMKKIIVWILDNHWYYSIKEWKKIDIDYKIHPNQTIH